MIQLLLILNITFMYSAPLIFAALGGVISEKSGVVNLALEGLMTIGAFIAVLVAHKTGDPFIGFLAAGFSGMLLCLLHAFASITLKADQTISGIALNLMGPGLALFLSRIFFEGSVMTTPVPRTIPKILTFLGVSVEGDVVLQNLNIDLTVFIALLIAALMYFVFYKTKWGLRVLAVGEHPQAADSLGINVYKVRYACVLLSGFLAGLGGAACSLAIVAIFSPTIISGKGFIALAAVIFGKWKPHGAVLACLLFGFAQALVVVLGGTSLDISPHLLSMIPYVLTLLILIAFVGKSVAPKSSGQPFEKGIR
ncbi:MAG: ABC transporter permease [Clostridiales bacterium]|jgi:simple sugar transport system permease protein|nr:ABC transporter permease [Clostridiales bacterium]